MSRTVIRLTVGILALLWSVTVGAAGELHLRPVTDVKATSPTWEQVADLPTLRSSVAVTAGIDGRIFAMGGDTGFLAPTAALEIYNPVTNSWCSSEVILPSCGSVSPMGTALSGAGAAASLDGRVFVFGGQISGPNFQSLVQIYDPETNGWSYGPSMPTARTTPAVTRGGDGRIIVIGGSNGSAPLNVVEVFNPVSNTWCSSAVVLPGCVTSPPPLSVGQNSENGAATGADGTLYAVGGYYPPGGSTFSPGLVQKLGPSSVSWAASTSNVNFTGRVALAAARGSDGRIYAIGGAIDGGPFLDVVEAYDPMTGAWDSSVDGLNFARYTHGAAALADGRIYVIGGSAGNTRTEIVECLSTGTVACIPPPDGDGDGVPDDTDACTGENATGFDANNDGCIDRVASLTSIIDTLVLEEAISATLQNSLHAKIGAAMASFTSANVCAAVNELNALKQQIAAQTDKKISAEAAAELLPYITSVQSFLMFSSATLC